MPAQSDYTAAVCGAVLAAAPIVFRGVAFGMGREGAKDDETYATVTDYSAQEAMFHALQGTGLPVVGEEDAKRPMPPGRFVLVDPTDGTAAGRAGAGTATAGASIYNPRTRTFESAAVVDPFTGRLWFYSDGRTYVRYLDRDTLLPDGPAVTCQVSKRTLSDGGEVAIEVSHGFTRTDAFTGERRLVLDGRSAVELQYRLQQCPVGTKVRGWSSNLYHQALVADGMRPGGTRSLVATVMTAVGGPWDMSGLALVRGAGGVVYLLRLEGGFVQLVDDPMSADMVICANTNNTAQTILRVLHGVVGDQAARLA